MRKFRDECYIDGNVNEEIKKSTTKKKAIMGHFFNQFFWVSWLTVSGCTILKAQSIWREGLTWGGGIWTASYSYLGGGFIGKSQW